MQRQLTTTELESHIHAILADINTLRNKHNKIASAMMYSIVITGAIRLLFLMEQSPFYSWYSKQCVDLFNQLDGSLLAFEKDVSRLEKQNDEYWTFSRHKLMNPQQEALFKVVNAAENMGMVFKTDDLKVHRLLNIVVNNGGDVDKFIDHIRESIPALRYIQAALVKKPLHLMGFFSVGMMAYFNNRLQIQWIKPEVIQHPITLLSDGKKTVLANRLNQILKQEKSRDQKISMSIMFGTTCLLLPIIGMESPPVEMIALFGMLLVPYIHYLQKEAKRWYRHKNKRFIIDAFAKALQIKIHGQEIDIERLRNYGDEKLSLTSFLQINFKNHNEFDRRNLKRALKHYLDQKSLYYSFNEKNDFIITVDDDLLAKPDLFSDFNEKMQSYFNKIQALDDIIVLLHKQCPLYSFMEAFTFSSNDRVSCKFFMRVNSNVEMNLFDNMRLQMIKCEENGVYIFLSIELFDVLDPSEQAFLNMLAKNISQPREAYFDGTLAKGHARTAPKKKINEEIESKVEAVSTVDNDEEVKITWPSGLVFVGSLKSPQYTDAQGRRIFEIRSNHAPRFSFFGVLARPVTELTDDEGLQNQMVSILEDPKVVSAEGQRGFVNDDGTFKWKFLGQPYGDTRVECSGKEKAVKQVRNGEEEKCRSMPLFHYADEPTTNYHANLSRR